MGGLTVFREVERALPGESLIYLGDTARVDSLRITWPDGETQVVEPPALDRALVITR